MSVIEKIEQDILSQVKIYAGVNWQISAFYDDVSAFDISDISTAVFVRYSGSRYETENDISSAIQNRIATFQIHYVAQDTHSGVNHYQALETLRTCLQGLRTQGSFMTVIKDQPISVADGAWHWLFEAECPFPLISHRPHSRILADNTDHLISNFV